VFVAQTGAAGPVQPEARGGGRLPDAGGPVGAPRSPAPHHPRPGRPPGPAAAAAQLRRCAAACLARVQLMLDQLCMLQGRVCWVGIAALILLGMSGLRCGSAAGSMHICQRCILAGFSDHDLLFTRPNEHAGAAEPGPPPDAASQQRRGSAVPPARRRAAGTEPACATAGIIPASLSNECVYDVLRVITRT
jgi:hypothetical protein